MHRWKKDKSGNNKYVLKCVICGAEKIYVGKYGVKFYEYYLNGVPQGRKVPKCKKVNNN